MQFSPTLSRPPLYSPSSNNHNNSTTTITTAPPSREDWQKRKSTIQRLYIDERMKLSDVREYMMKYHNFDASEKQYKDKFVQWRLRKNIKKEDFEWMIRMYNLCKAQDRHVTFRFQGEEVKWSKITRFMRRYPQSRDSSRSADGTQRGHLDIPDGIEMSITPPYPKSHGSQSETPPSASVSPSDYRYQGQPQPHPIAMVPEEMGLAEYQKTLDGLGHNLRQQSEQAHAMARDEEADYSNGCTTNYHSPIAMTGPGWEYPCYFKTERPMFLAQ